jgi:predicted MFS family arabinose efflux permease
MNTIVYLLLTNCYFGINYSLIAPLYPAIAIEKGLSEDIIGMILSVYALFTVLVTPLIPRLQKIVGKKKLLQLSLIVQVYKE